jgi:hypothetical protein
MAGSRTLKLSILADVDDLNKKLKAANTDVETSADKITKWGKAAAAGFAIAGAAAIKFGLDFAKAAAEDAAAQEKLDATIKATTDATDAQVKAVGDWITKTSVAIGITDDELRPAFSRLVRSTKDTEEAQRLLSLAMDLSSATSKPLEGVTNALAKAYDGNYTALNKLGLGIDASAIKAKDFDGITANLAATFGDFAENEAETAAKKFERIKIATDEAKESIGAALLPIVEKISDYLLTTFIPNLESLINGLTGEGSLAEATAESTDKAYKWGQQIQKIIKTVINFKDELIAVAGVIATVFVVSKITAAVSATIAVIRTLITAYNALKASAVVAGVATAFALNPLLGVGAVALAAGVLAGANALANRGNADLPEAPSTGSIPYASGFAPTQGGTYTPPTPTSTGGGGGGTSTGGGGVNTAVQAAAIASNVVTGSFNAGSFRTAEAKTSGDNYYNINVTGALDKEGVARQIVEIINESSYRGGGGSGAALIA